jgi:hypothetical protein
LRIFSDQTSLEMSESAWGSIKAAMGASKSFVLMASPDAAESPWVDREVRFWRQHRPRSNFSIVLTNGDISWDSARGDFDWDATTALPRSLSGWFDDEPLWSDVRPPPGLRTHRDQRNDRLRNAARTIAAPLYGVEKDQLDGEDERESRRARRTLRAGIAALSVLSASRSTAPPTRWRSATPDACSPRPGAARYGYGTSAIRPSRAGWGHR